MLKKLFNSNTGYFLKKTIYNYEGKPHIGYILCRGSIWFGIPVYDRIDAFCDLEDAQEAKRTYESL